jgi:hypothetical protein
MTRIDTEVCSVAGSEFCEHSIQDNILTDCQIDLSIEEGHCVLEHIRKLEKENRQLRDALQRSQMAVLQIQSNLSCKMVRMERENVYLNKQISEELATNSKLIVENRLLQKQVQNLKSQQFENRADSHMLCEECNHDQSHQQYDHEIEKQLAFLVSRYEMALVEVSILKDMLIDTCEPCRQRCLQTKRKTPLSFRKENLAEKKRPTFRTSARCFLENIPNHSADPVSKQYPLHHTLLVASDLPFSVQTRDAAPSNSVEIFSKQIL